MLSKSNHLKQNYPYSFLVPGLMIFTLFFVYPMLSGIYHSFTFWNFKTTRFCGWQNYAFIFGKEHFLTSLWNTLKFTGVTTVITFLLALFLSLFLKQKLRLGTYFKTVSYMPVIMNYIAVGVTFSSLFHPATGLLNRALAATGLEFLAQDYLYDTRFSIYTISVIQVWKECGFFTLIFLAGLMSIPSMYYEAADIDGASFWGRLRFIILPMLMSQVNNVLVLLLVRGFKVFDIVMATTKGGPGYQTSTLNIFAYQALVSRRVGESCAGMVFLAIVCSVIGIFVANLLRRKEVEL